MSIMLLLSFPLTGTLAQESCPECSYADTLLKPCNSSLQMQTWPGTLVYQPTEQQAPCACNDNYYGQMAGCLKCQSSTSAKYSVKPLADYQLVCTAFHQVWTPIYLPSKSTTAVPSSTSTTTSSSNSIQTGDRTSNGNGHSNLSSGAIAGIIVSVVALVVALSVAGYVWNRRRKEVRRGVAGDMDEYKYRDNQTDSYMEHALPQYTGMIQPTLPPLSNLTNLRVMNPDYEEGGHRVEPPQAQYTQSPTNPSFEVRRGSSPGWRRGSFDDD